MTRVLRPTLGPRERTSADLTAKLDSYTSSHAAPNTFCKQPLKKLKENI
jgi:hypothetical protein